MDLLALSETATVGLVGAGAAFGGTVVGAAISFGGTRWEQGRRRHAVLVDAIRELSSEYLEIAAGAPVTLSYISDAETFEREQQKLRSRLWSPRARIALYPQAEPINAAMAWFIHVVAETGSPPSDEARHLLQQGIGYVTEVAASTLHAIEHGLGLSTKVPDPPFEVQTITDFTRPQSPEQAP